MGRPKTTTNGHYQQSANEMAIERIQTTILKKKAELDSAEEAVKRLKREIVEWNYALGGGTSGIEQSVREASEGSEATSNTVIRGHSFEPTAPRKEYTRRVVTERQQIARNNRANSPDWSPEEDATLVNFFRGEAKAVPPTAREAAVVLPNRSEKAITQRMYRLAANGALKRTGGGPGSQDLRMEAI